MRDAAWYSVFAKGFGFAIAASPQRRAAFIGRRLPAHEAILATADSLHVKFLAGFDAILLANLGGQYELTLGGNGRLHVG